MVNLLLQASKLPSFIEVSTGYVVENVLDEVINSYPLDKEIVQEYISRVHKNVSEVMKGKAGIVFSGKTVTVITGVSEYGTTDVPIYVLTQAVKDGYLDLTARNYILLPSVEVMRCTVESLRKKEETKDE